MESKRITYDLLESMGVCGEGLEWFKGKYPNGCELQEMIDWLQDGNDVWGYTKWLFEEFKLTGVCKGFYKSGELEFEHNYKDGDAHGVSKEFYEYGELMYEFNYKDGKLNGVYKGFYKSGELMYELNYKDGSIIKEG